MKGLKVLLQESINKNVDVVQFVSLVISANRNSDALGCLTEFLRKSKLIKDGTTFESDNDYSDSFYTYAKVDRNYVQTIIFDYTDAKFVKIKIRKGKIDSCSEKLRNAINNSYIGLHKEQDSEFDIYNIKK